MCVFDDNNYLYRRLKHNIASLIYKEQSSGERRTNYAKIIQLLLH